MLGPEPCGAELRAAAGELHLGSGSFFSIFTAGLSVQGVGIPINLGGIITLHFG